MPCKQLCTAIVYSDQGFIQGVGKGDNPPSNIKLTSHVENDLLVLVCNTSGLDMEMDIKFIGPNETMPQIIICLHIS